jgi:mRNA-degrading endonuclease toxin of MazEF toxin-antitoxin module
MGSRSERAKGDDGVDRLPLVGELYWVETWIFGGDDPKPNRPVVVVQAPRTRLHRVHVIARTTNTSIPGVVHSPDSAHHAVNKPGVFSMKFHRSAEAVVFVKPTVELVGVVDPECLTEVLEMWETS